MNKVVIQVAGIGTVDKCDHCGKEFTTGIAGFVYEGWVEIDLCDDCFKKYYVEKNPK